MEQAPGPRGSPHDPQGDGAESAEGDESLATANLEICCVRRLLSHLGQRAFCWPSTMASNLCSHSRQMYSKIGIKVSSVKMIVNPLYLRDCFQSPCPVILKKSRLSRLYPGDSCAIG